METLYEDKFVKMSLDQENELLIDVWTPETEQLTVDGFKKLLLVFKDLVTKHHLKYALTDTLQFLLPMAPSLQEWTLENITIPLSKETQYIKHAFIMPMEFIANLSIEQFAEETNSSAVKTMYFGNMTEARKWLLGDAH